jgi:hypothetical protein
MKRLHVIGALAAALATAALPGAADAKRSTDAAPKAEFIGKIKNHGDYATLHVRYNCNDADALWVSAKQSATGAKDDALTAPESSGVAATMWHSHRNAFTCDGRSRTAKMTVDTVEWGFGDLRKGYAWVQFCLSRGDEDMEIYELGWVPVR